jgi:hypothetical protein
MERKHKCFEQVKRRVYKIRCFQESRWQKEQFAVNFGINLMERGEAQQTLGVAEEAIIEREQKHWKFELEEGLMDAKSI